MLEILREYRVKFERVPQGEKAVEPNALGLRSKLGGKPDWEQDDETPMCPNCKEPMLFVAQIDSIEHNNWKWCKYEEAMKLLSWENNKNALDFVHKFLGEEK